MEPIDISKSLISIANYIENDRHPSIVTVRDEISHVLVSLAGQFTKFVHKDYEVASNGLGILIDKLSKAAKTMNPQDESREAIESVVDHFQDLRKSLKSGFDSLKSVEI